MIQSKKHLIRGMTIATITLLLVGCFQNFNPNHHNENVPEPGTKYNQTNSPIGGGIGYKSILVREKADYIITSLEELKQALGKVKRGEIIFIPGDVEISLSGKTSIEIPAHVTIAGDRGYRGSKGALLYQPDFGTGTMIRVKGNGVRISGLRIEGPDKEVGESKDARPRVSGIKINKYDSLEVDNSEIYGWSLAGIYLRDSKNNFIHHNLIHLNRRKGLGYGVVLYSFNKPANALIEANYFRYDRHSIAGSGQLGVSYEARYNYVTRSTTSHNFDMHGDYESPGTGTIYAGYEIRIHHNTFNVKNQGVVIRGVPKKGAWIYQNNFIGSEQDVAVRQKNYFGNLHVFENKFKGPLRAWYVSWNGSEDWYALKIDPIGAGIKNTYTGDFNGDQKNDLLICKDGLGLITYNQDRYDGYSALKNYGYNLTSDTCDNPLIGDFNGDLKDEIASIHNGKIYHWDLRTGGMDQLGELKPAMKPKFTRVGDFDGDGKDDLFAFDGSNWFVSYNSQIWKSVYKQKVTPNQILVGRFSDKKHDDVLMVQNNELFLHTFPPYSQTLLDIDKIKTKSGPFLAGDFDGDGLTDLLAVESDNIIIYYNKLKKWKTLRSSSHTIDDFKISDINGDQISDIITNQDSLW